jgi:hypothetical protein
MMSDHKVSVTPDHSKGVRGRLKVTCSDSYEGDAEFILKHPLLLRIRLALAVSRLHRRARKLRKFLARHN